MARKRYPPDDPREWLKRARSNLALARAEEAGVILEDLCFEAQQSAEKAIKAVFIQRGETFPYIHDLERLLQLLERNGLKVPKYVKHAQELTRFALLTRYPGLSKPAITRTYRRAVRIADSIVGWADRQIKKK
jgi:HEPN domain-containing protein